MSIPTSFVASAYVIGLGSVEPSIHFSVVYWDAGFNELGATYTVVATSLTEWQRVSHTYPVPETAAYVSVRISLPRRYTPRGSCQTAFKLEAGTEPTPYGGGGANLLFNPECATDLAYWSPEGLEAYEISHPLDGGVFFRATVGGVPSMPSSPLPGITTALKYVSPGFESNIPCVATHRTIALADIPADIPPETYGANVLINGGASVVFERDVTLALNPGSVAATEMAIRNDEGGYGAWEAFATTKAWTLSAACKVWAKFRDGA